MLTRVYQHNNLRYYRPSKGQRCVVRLTGLINGQLVSARKHRLALTSSYHRCPAEFM
jgi:hypothetical protein